MDVLSWVPPSATRCRNHTVPPPKSVPQSPDCEGLTISGPIALDSTGNIGWGHVVEFHRGEYAVVFFRATVMLRNCLAAQILSQTPRSIRTSRLNTTIGGDAHCSPSGFRLCVLSLPCCSSLSFRLVEMEKKSHIPTRPVPGGRVNSLVHLRLFLNAVS